MKRYIKTALAFVILVAADQAAKWWALAVLKDKEPIPLIKGVLELYYLENRGAAFGVLQNQQWFFLIITLLVAGAILWALPRIPREKKYRYLYWCLCLLGAGAVGNVIDRLFRRYVVDFIYFKLIDFPIFNVADIYVTVSTFCLVILIFFYYKEEDLEKMVKKNDKNKPGGEGSH